MHNLSVRHFDYILSASLDAIIPLQYIPEGSSRTISCGGIINLGLRRIQITRARYGRLISFTCKNKDVKGIVGNM